MASKLKYFQKVYDQVKIPEAISVDFSVIEKGTDNYHVDIEISAKFTQLIRDSIENNIEMMMDGKPLDIDSSKTMKEIGDVYKDIMTATLNRANADLEVDQIVILQFAIVKSIIQEVKDGLKRYNELLEDRLAQAQYGGSRTLLIAKQSTAVYRKHYTEYILRLTKLHLRPLARTEHSTLKGQRAQVLGDKLTEVVDILYDNPLLCSQTPKAPLLLLDFYAVWPGNGNNFNELNTSLESSFRKYFPKLETPPLKTNEKLSKEDSEVFDELGGLFVIQSILGPPEDQKNIVHEEFSWLEEPDNILLLFDAKIQEYNYVMTKDKLSMVERLKLKGNITALIEISQEIRKSIGDKESVRLMLSGYSLHQQLNQPALEVVSILDAMHLVHDLNKSKIDGKIDKHKTGASLVARKLTDCIDNFEKQKNTEDSLWFRFLIDYSRYRLHLKYFRFCHRIFNRLTIITDEEQLEMAKVGDNLYRLLTSKELKENTEDSTEPKIIHHTILKADVRGSTTVVSELIKRGLNPASYFSSRFFNPINERLANYGAVKVFIEGDAIILVVYEYETSPDQWFSVSRACGIAKEIKDIVNAKNAHSKQTGVPPLELGFGICYRDVKPFYLLDINRKVMISEAIGDADRLSSCSWMLRAKYDPGYYNVGVMQYENSSDVRSDKGQDLIRYNVSGIVIDDLAFEKIKTEVNFQEVNIKLKGVLEKFLVGRYPDIKGKKRSIVIREGKVGVWGVHGLVPNSDTGIIYHEILQNTNFAHKMIKLAKAKRSRKLLAAQSNQENHP